MTVEFLSIKLFKKMSLLRMTFLFPGDCYEKVTPVICHMFETTIKACWMYVILISKFIASNKYKEN